MKWDGNLLSEIVKDGLYSLFNYDIEKAHQMDNKEYAALLKKKHTYSGKSFKNCYVSTIPNGITIRFLKPFPKELDDDNTIEISWSMAARFIRAWEYEKRQENNSQFCKSQFCVNCINNGENCVLPKGSDSCIHFVEKPISKVQQQWDETHLCGDYNGKHCEYLVQAERDTVLNGKKLDSWCLYCTSENKVRKIGSAGSWTGLSPQFCPKRKTMVTNNKEDKQMAKKRTFDTAILNDIKSVAGDSFADNIKMISLEQLHDNKDNFYDLSDLDTLIEDIDRQGLKTPLYVVPDESGYTIISGHRRKAAVTELINSGKYGTDKLPCYVGSKKSEAETMLDLIMLNATSRVITDAETMKQCEKLEEVFKQLETDGKKVQGRMRDKIAAALNVSPAQVGKVENIRHNAIDEVKAAVDEGKMSISTANEVAKLDVEEQKDLIEKKKPEKITHKEVKKSVEASKKSTSPIQKLQVINDRLENGEDVSADEINLDETNLQTLQLLQMSEVSKDDEAYDDGSEDIALNEFEEKSVSKSDDNTIFTPSASEDPQLTEADIEKAKATAELWKKPPEYFNKIIDSGMCNSIISGYVLLILEEMGIDRPVDIFKTINSVLDFYAAQAAREKFSCN